MNWLIISNDEEALSSLTKTINAKDKDAKVTQTPLTESDIKKVSGMLFDLTHIILVANDEDLSNQEIALALYVLSGFAFAARLPIYTTYEKITQALITDKNGIAMFTAWKDIKRFLDSSYEAIKDEQLKLEAKKALLDEGIPFTPNCFGQYIAKDKMEICNNFYTAGMDVNSKDDTGTPMLNIAVREDHEELVSWLIEKGADINVLSEDRGYTPLMDAVWRGNFKVAQQLISLGADTNTICKEGQSNLVLAVGSNKKDIVKLLAENGSDPDVKDAMGMSAWGYANLFHKEELVEILKPYHKE